ncbi:38042_t:CDS:2, partial [Gigaspora margarita]
YSKSRFVKFQNVTSFNRYENTIEADKIEYIMYYPDRLFYLNHIEKGFYRESGTYIKYFILRNNYIFVDSKKKRRILANSEIERLLNKLNLIDPLLANTWFNTLDITEITLKLLNQKLNVLKTLYITEFKQIIK